MTKTTIKFLIAAALFSFGSLFAGAGYLIWPLPGGLPLGNALAALGLITASAAALAASDSKSVLQILSIVSLAFSVAWLPVSIGLAGNLELNFNEIRGALWIQISLVTFALALVLLVWAIFRIASEKGRRNDVAGAA